MYAMKSNVLKFTFWCFFMATLLLVTVSGAYARTAKRYSIEEQLARIRNTQNRTGIRLANNQDWHDWLMINS